MRRPFVLLSIAVLAGLALGSCGDDDAQDAIPTTDGGGGGAEVDVVAEDIHFDQGAYAAAAGTVEVTYRNDGSIGHTLRFDGVDGFKLEVANHGDSDQAGVELEPGTYTLYCDVPGHRQAGMEATLEVG